MHPFHECTFLQSESSTALERDCCRNSISCCGTFWELIPPPRACFMVLSPLPEGTAKWLKAGCQKCYLSQYSVILASKTGILTCVFYSNTAYECACAQRHELCRSRNAWISELARHSLAQLLCISSFVTEWVRFQRLLQTPGGGLLFAIYSTNQCTLMMLISVTSFSPTNQTPM